MVAVCGALRRAEFLESRSTNSCTATAPRLVASGVASKTLGGHFMHQTDDTCNHAGFTPLHADEPDCLIGYRSDAKASELFDEAMLRQHAVLGLLCTLSGASHLHESCSDSLNGCIQAIRILCSDTAALYAGAWQAMRRETT